MPDRTIAGPSIPMEHYFASAKDVTLRALMRKKVKLLGKVDDAQAAVVAAEAEIQAYVEATYPAGAPANIAESMPAEASA